MAITARTIIQTDFDPFAVAAHTISNKQLAENNIS